MKHGESNPMEERRYRATGCIGIASLVVVIIVHFCHRREPLLLQSMTTTVAAAAAGLIGRLAIVSLRRFDIFTTNVRSSPVFDGARLVTIGGSATR